MTAMTTPVPLVFPSALQAPGTADGPFETVATLDELPPGVDAADHARRPRRPPRPHRGGHRRDRGPLPAHGGTAVGRRSSRAASSPARCTAGAFDLRDGSVVVFPTTGGLDADGNAHEPWSPPGSPPKPPPADTKALARCAHARAPDPLPAARGSSTGASPSAFRGERAGRHRRPRERPATTCRRLGVECWLGCAVAARPRVDGAHLPAVGAAGPARERRRGVDSPVRAVAHVVTYGVLGALLFCALSRHPASRPRRALAACGRRGPLRRQRRAPPVARARPDGTASTMSRSTRSARPSAIVLAAVVTLLMRRQERRTTAGRRIGPRDGP